MTSNRGFGVPYRILRKRTVLALSFLLYLDGIRSAASAWADRGASAVAVAASGLQLMPFGYRGAGAGALTGNLGLDGTDLEQFTLMAVVVRNEHSGDDAVFSGLFNGVYPRLYFSGTDLIAEVQLDGSPITLTVADVGDYITPGVPAFLVLRGKYSEGTELLIDGTVRATSATTGADYDASSQAFELMQDTDQSLNFNGQLRGVFFLSQKLTDGNLDTVKAMLEYEGYFDPWRDNMKKWSGSATFTGGENSIGDSPYMGTIVES